MPTELRCKIAPAVLAKLDELRDHLGYRARGDVLQHLIVDAHGKHLGRSGWGHLQSHAYRVLRRLKPEVLIGPDEIIDVAFKEQGERVLITVALNSAPYQVSRREWEKS